MKPRDKDLGLTQARLHELLHYDPATGVFTHRRQHQRVWPGSVAGCRHRLGYIMISITDHMYLAHRLAWLYMTGDWPEDRVDHENGERADNRWCNLRPATHSENQRNRKGKTGKTIAKGVTLKKQYVERGWKPYRAQIRVNGKPKELGYFATEEEAARAYAEAAHKYFGKFARTA